MDEQTRRKVAELVAGIIATDGELHPAELTFMRRVRERLGIETGASDDELGVKPELSAVKAADAMRELDEGLQQETLQLLVQTATVDGKVMPAERNFLVTVANAAGVSTKELFESLTDSLLYDHEEDES